MAGKGSCFSVQVPVTPQTASSAVKRLDPSESARRAGSLLLCIDDDEAILRSFEALLKNWDYRTVCAKDSRDALHRLQGKIPDIVMIDYRLGEAGTGLDILDELRRAWQCEVEAIIVTADRSPGVRHSCKERSCEVLYKPVKPASLRRFLMGATLRRQLSSRRGAA